MATPPVFTSGSVLTAAQMNSVGLWLVKTQTIGAAVSSVTVSSVFNADYDTYQILISGGTATNDGVLKLSLGASVTGYYQGRAGITYATGLASNGSDNNTTQWNGGAGVHGANGIYGAVTLIGPYLAKYTQMTLNYASATDGVAVAGIHKVASSYTSFTITTAAGTMTGGTIYVYGYKGPA